MSKPSNQSQAWDFSVSSHAMPNPVRSGHNIPNFFGLFRDDTGELLGTGTEQYQVLQNHALLDSARGVLAARGLVGYEESILVTGGGKKLFAQFTFKDKLLATAKGDLVGYQLTLQNSFDGTLKAAYALGFLRLACLNGMCTTENEFALASKHNQKMQGADFLKSALDAAMAAGERAIGVYDELQTIACSNEQGMHLLDNCIYIPKPKVPILSERLGANIKLGWLQPKRKEDKARNLYSLYNAVTEYLTHSVQPTQFELARSVNMKLLTILVSAARSTATFAKMTTPVPDSAKGARAQVILIPASASPSQAPFVGLPGARPIVDAEVV